MSLVERINTDLTSAMKTQDTGRTAVLRLIKTSMTNERIKLGKELSDDDVLKLLQKEAKQRRDSIDAYNSGGRGDLAAEEEAELILINEYLPKQLHESELFNIIDQVIADLGATELSQAGLVIGKVMGLVTGRADGGLVSRLVKERLS
ncbi:MAG: GatB/YqeY domain-containing protein [Candidatus Saccharimonadia bacterium]